MGPPAITITEEFHLFRLLAEALTSVSLGNNNSTLGRG